MKVGNSVKTLPTVKPKLYAGKVGTIAIKNDGEIGVLIAGRVVWFLEREIEEWEDGSLPTQLPTTATIAANGKSVKGQTNQTPATGVRHAGQSSSVTSAEETGRTTTRVDQPDSTPPRVMSTSTREGGLGAQESAREGQEVGAKVSRPPRGEPGGPQEGTAIDSRGVDGPEGESAVEPLSPPSWPAESLSGLNPGERGPGGGVVAQCLACSGLWERPKQRGRPSLNCPRCR